VPRENGQEGGIAENGFRQLGLYGVYARRPHAQEAI
jgi:hypothetical protein